MKKEGEKKKREYLIINVTRVLSSGDFSSYTPRGRLKVNFCEQIK